jgi:hypothetical protein
LGFGRTGENPLPLLVGFLGLHTPLLEHLDRPQRVPDLVGLQQGEDLTTPRESDQ